ncbi:MAG: hypothetical protein M9922_07180 [Microthrixaceae bacterium]|nr:hypothetical protein [Microthrixaceae bacterium]
MSEQLLEAGSEPAVLVHPDATIGGARLGAGSVVAASCTVASDARVGDHAHIDPGCTIHSGVRVGAFSWVGANTVIGPNSVLGARCVIGPGSVISAGVVLDDDTEVPSAALVCAPGTTPSGTNAAIAPVPTARTDRMLAVPQQEWVSRSTNIAIWAAVLALLADVTSRVLKSGSEWPLVGAVATGVALVGYVTSVSLATMRRREPDTDPVVVWYRLGVCVLLTLSLGLRWVYWVPARPTPGRAAVPLAAALVVEALARWHHRRWVEASALTHDTDEP